MAVVGERSWAELQAMGILLPARTPYVQVSNSAAALARLCAAMHGHPSRRMTVIGVTGTDGKTTTCTLLESILNAATRTSPESPGAVGVITTVGARIRGVESDTGFHVTTPDAPQIQAFLAHMVEAGCQYAIVESTSHGLAQHRVDSVAFDVAAVTNITHEHLDYHKSYDAYVAAKARLFQSLFVESGKQSGVRAAVLNGDDPLSYPRLTDVIAQMDAIHPGLVQTYVYSLDSARNAALVQVQRIEVLPQFTRIELNIGGESLVLETRLMGEFNVYNILCAVTIALALGVGLHHIQIGVGDLTGVIGRMERMDRGQDFLAVVDFAHSPASLERALKSLRHLVSPNPDGKPGRLIAVFGSAGLRDQAKRRLMGQVSGRLADYTVVTAEDPRTESLAEINREIAAGLAEYTSSQGYIVVPDRNAAIQVAVDMAQPGDVVAAFGKGHEQSMCFGDVEYPWRDQQAMRNALDRRLGKIVSAQDEFSLPTATLSGNIL